MLASDMCKDEAHSFDTECKVRQISNKFRITKVGKTQAGVTADRSLGGPRDLIGPLQAP